MRFPLAYHILPSVYVRPHMSPVSAATAPAHLSWAKPPACHEKHSGLSGNRTKELPASELGEHSPRVSVRWRSAPWSARLPSSLLMCGETSPSPTCHSAFTTRCTPGSQLPLCWNLLMSGSGLKLRWLALHPSPQNIPHLPHSSKAERGIRTGLPFCLGTI